MNMIQIDRQTCNRDGICAEVCPMKLIELDGEGVPTAIPETEALCVRCGHCVAVCPMGCLSHRDIPVTQCPPVRRDLLLSADQCEHFLRQRRSIRVYEDKPVPREALERLIQVARYAPSGRNIQSARWLVVDNRQELQRLGGIVYDWMRWMLTNMKQFALSLGMDRAVTGWEAGQDIFLRGAPALIIAHAEKDDRLAPSTCTIALTYLELAATSMDLGCCWAGYLNAAAANYPPMMEALALPEGHQCFGAMMVGYPKYRYHRLPLRDTPAISWR